MASSSSNTKVKEGKEVLNVQLISNEIKQPIFKAILNNAYKQDPIGVLSTIPPQVLMIQDVRCCYTCKVDRKGDMEIKYLYGKMCEKWNI